LEINGKIIELKHNENGRYLKHNGKILNEELIANDNQ